jgi:hypothetical protein
MPAYFAHFLTSASRFFTTFASSYSQAAINEQHVSLFAAAAGFLFFCFFFKLMSRIQTRERKSEVGGGTPRKKIISLYVREQVSE